MGSQLSVPYGNARIINLICCKMQFYFKRHHHPEFYIRTWALLMTLTRMPSDTLTQGYYRSMLVIYSSAEIILLLHYTTHIIKNSAHRLSFSIFLSPTQIKLNFTTCHRVTMVCITAELKVKNTFSKLYTAEQNVADCEKSWALVI